MASESGLSAATEESIREVQGKIPADLFPLPLSPFEKFVLWDGTLEHPMISYVEMHFDSALDHQRLQEALAFAVHCHPLLASRIVERNGQLYWEYDPSYRPTIHFENEQLPLQHGRPRPIDLMNEFGLLVWYRHDEAGGRVLIQSHHSCCDGIGLRRMVIDWFNYYARSAPRSQALASTEYSTNESAAAKITVDEASGEELSVQELSVDENGLNETTANQLAQANWERLDPAVLKHRGQLAEAFSERPSRPLSTWQRIRNAHYFHFQPPQPLLTPVRRLSTAEDQNATEPLRHSILEREASEAIFECCRLRGVGTNELGLALLFRTCAQWNRLHGKAVGSSRLRLLMPYQLLSRVDLRMPAANRLSYTFLGRTHAQCDDLDSLLAGIHEEIESLRETHLPLDFINGLTVACQRPALMKWALKRSRHMCTAVLTYAGNVSRGMQRHFPQVDGTRVMGDARLKNAFVAPPVRAQTNVSLGLCVNWGQLCISAAWNRDALTGTECQAFIDMYRNGWLEWLEQQSK
jgi:hypothetical protein